MIFGLASRQFKATRAMLFVNSSHCLGLYFMPYKVKASQAFNRQHIHSYPLHQIGYKKQSESDFSNVQIKLCEGSCPSG